MNSSFETITGLLANEIKALLVAYGATSTEHVVGGLPSPGRWIMASIGCSGRQVRGALTLVASPDFWRRLAEPAAIGTCSDALLSDMAGEIANMIMGRLRNRLLLFGVEVHQATPTCAFGDAIVLSDPGDALSTWQRFSTWAGEVHGRFDAFLGPDLELSADSEDAVQPCESDLVLF